MGDGELWAGPRGGGNDILFGGSLFHAQMLV